MSTSFVKDPDAVLDYLFDFSGWLDDAETIQSYTVTVSDGLTKDSDSESAGTVTVWLSGGQAGDNATVACRVTTSAGRTDERTATIRVRDR